MRDNGRKSFVQAYNAQIAVDAYQQVIVAAEITQKTTDREQLLPMVRSVCMTTARIPETVTADAGYRDTSSLRDSGLHGVQVLVSPDAQVQPPGTTLAPNAPNSPEAVRMREVLLTPMGKLLYSFRKATVEPVFGQIKEVRGLRRFRFRGLRRVESESKLICATHNLLKLFRYRTALLPT
jgi:DDE family transposase